jgi:hypothetical protein
LLSAATVRKSKHDVARHSLLLCRWRTGRGRASRRVAVLAPADFCKLLGIEQSGAENDAAGARGMKIHQAGIAGPAAY